MKKLFILSLIVFYNFYVSFQIDPKGWSDMIQIIQNTKFQNISELKDKSFNLEIDGLTSDYSLALTPLEAFNIQIISDHIYKVTIIKPEDLVNKDDFIYKYYPIEYIISKIERIGPAILGESYCTTTAIFKQEDRELDLTEMSDTYNYSYELSDPSAVSSVSRSGKGYVVVRSTNSSSVAKIRLKLEKKDGSLKYTSSWLDIPICSSPVDPDAQKPISPPTTRYISSSNPYNDLNIKITSISICENELGIFCTTLRVEAKNTGTTFVRCNDVIFHMSHNKTIIAQNTHWIALNPGQKHIFDVTLQSKIKPDNFIVNFDKRNCIYP